MNTKLTLTLEKAVIEQAKEYAREHKRSLSDLVEQYFKSLVTEEGRVLKEPSPVSYSLRGAFKNQAETDDKTLITKSLEEKYLKDE